MISFFHNFLSSVRDSLAATVYNKLFYSQSAQHLKHLALNSSERGIADYTDIDEEIVVSLTSHGRRIFEVYLAVESIMQGSVKPHRIILWLSNEQKGKSLPQTLLNQMKRGLEVRFTDDLGPYTKLIPTLMACPGSTIITIDDDIIYPFDTVESLLVAHREHPSHICANRILEMKIGKNGGLEPLVTWKELEDKAKISSLGFFEGVGGVLYPSRCFSDEVFNQSVYSEICPTADDVWFNCMAKLANTSVTSANQHYLHFPLMINESIQDSALWRVNHSNSHYSNDAQLRTVMSRYNLHFQ